MPRPRNDRRPATWRLPLGMVVAAAAAALGALMLGEYDFAGLLPWIGGPIFGAVLAEIFVAVSGRHLVLGGVFAGLLAAAGLLWAAWISSGEGLVPPPWGLGPGMALATAAAVLWTGPAQPAPAAPSARNRIRVRRWPERGSR